MRSIALCGDNPSAPIRSLENLGFTVIRMPRFFSLNFPVNTHCDMLMAVIGRYIVTSEDYANCADKQLNYICRYTDIQVITEKSPHLYGYPKEAKYNVLYTCNKLFCNKVAVSPIIDDLCRQLSIPVIHTNQGYCACSSAKCNGGIITGDPSIANALTFAGEDVLKISSGNISIDKYSYGFIGGASGYCSENTTLYINGDIALHPDNKRIADFCELHNCRLYSLNRGLPPYDIGGIIFL